MKDEYVDLDSLYYMIQDTFAMDLCLPRYLCKSKDIFNYISYSNFAYDEIIRFMANRIAPRTELTYKEAFDLAIEFTWRMSKAEHVHQENAFLFSVAVTAGCNVQDLLSAIIE